MTTTNRTDGTNALCREVDLIAAKAASMSPEQLSQEIARIDRAMAREDTSPKQWRRYAVRRAFMASALTSALQRSTNHIPNHD